MSSKISIANAQRKSIVVVLGMHRSGTSVVTRGLQVIGVDLGPSLMPAAVGNNEKGFFEDTEVHAINSGLLKSKGQDWYTLTAAQSDGLLDERQETLRKRAIELLKLRLQAADYFGMKDPRLCRLLPFWQSVFECLEIDVRYVIAVRNPLSVARSLEVRDKVPSQTSHHLWLEHILPSILLTSGKTRVLIDYDRLMAEPEKQITRMAVAIGFKGELDRSLMAKFCSDFLEEHLRHAAFDLKDVLEDRSIPEPVKSAAAVLDDIAADRISLDSESVASIFLGLAEQLRNLPRDTDFFDNVIQGLNKATYDKDVHIANLEEAMSARDGEVALLSQAVRDKDAHIANIERAMSARDGEVALLSQAVRDKDAHIANIERAMCERDGQVLLLTKLIHDKDTHIGNIERAVGERDARLQDFTRKLEEIHTQMAGLTKAVCDKDTHINNLDQVVAARESQLELLAKEHVLKDESIQQLHVRAVQLDFRLNQARTSLGWILAKPLRMLRGLLRRLNHKLRPELLPLNQLHLTGDTWQTTGANPQFLIIAERTWAGLAGWYWLDIMILAERSFPARMYLDVGEGFGSTSSLDLQFVGQGSQRFPIFVPPNCRAIRLDLRESPPAFKLKLRGMAKLNTAPKLPDEFLAQYGVYEGLGASKGNAACLEPINDIQPNEEPAYRWHSVGGDPWFVLSQKVSKKLRPGWYMIELCIRSNQERGNAKLYFDYGDGCNEKDAVAVPYRSGRVAKRLYHLTAMPRQIRFDPLEDAAKFSIVCLHLAPIFPMFARNRMLRRLSKRFALYQGQTPRRIWRTIRTKAAGTGVDAKDLLLQQYNETFSANGGTGSIFYAEWIAQFETPEFSDTATIKTVQESLMYRPTISVVMPTYNTHEVFLRQAIESVLGQSYPNLELCIADDASSKRHVRAVLEEYTQRDPRVRVAYRQKNGHISAASNSALALATGEYVALLDHDDVLANHALHFMVVAINQDPSAQILYSDEDKIDERGNRTEPHFKPDWNPDLFFSQNYVSHLGVYRRELLEHIGGFRAGVEGSQDQDLLLRCLPHVVAGKIVHVPKVLYHWRMVEGSTALAPGEKSYTSEAGIKALQDYFRTQGRHDVRVEAGVVPNTYRVHYPIAHPEPLVSLLIPTRDMLEVLEPCIDSILKKTTYPNYEIIILDNESVHPATLGYFERIQAEHSRVRVLPYPYPFNYSAINNYGARQAKGELIGLVNNDVEVINSEWLGEMVSHAFRPEIGCVGAKLYYADDTIQHAGVILGIGGVANHSHKGFPKQSHGYFGRLSVVQNYSAVTAACLLVRKMVYEEVGGLEEHLKVAFNDVDFCLKVRQAGYLNLWTPYAELYHHESKSRGSEDTPEKQARFVSEVLYMQEKWKDQLALDPMYSPNLTREKDDFSISHRN